MGMLKPKPVSTRQLMWDPSDRTYIGEISSTNGFGRVYDDACDEGLTLVGNRREVVFVIVDEDVKDGEVRFWTLKPASRKDEGIATVILFND